MFCYVVFLVFAALASAASHTHVHDGSFTPDIVLSVAHRNISIGGIFRETAVVNNSLPGPAVHLAPDKVVWIRVYNDMTDDNLTMHWHGLAQAAYPFSDGTPLASQWPIPPQHFFDYELKAPNDTVGTYYYHSHVGFQASTASGPLVVDDVEEPYKNDGERTVFIQEFWNQTDHQIEEGVGATPMRWSGEPNGWLINGKSISNYGVVDESSKELAIIEVDPEKEYRFRFIASTSLSLAMFAFANHTEIEIIEADAQYTERQPVEILQMGSGQRYSALFKTKSCRELLQFGKRDFYIQIESRDRAAIVRNFAILRYNTCGIPTDMLPTNENPSEVPINLPPTINGYLDYELRPLHDNNFPTAAEVTRRVIINTQQIANSYFVWQMNNNTWSEESSSVPHTVPHEPYLVSLYKNQSAYLPDYNAAMQNGGLDPTTKTYPAKIGEVVEIVFQQLGAMSLGKTPGGGLDTHPWHGHGMHHYDVGGGEGEWNETVVEERLQGKKPVLRDTTLLYRYTPKTAPGQKQGWRVWRLRIDQPGVWMLHCHTLQHMVMGMQTVWVHGDAEDIMKLGRPEVEGYLEYGGDVYGNSTHSPSVLHFHEAI